VRPQILINGVRGEMQDISVLAQRGALPQRFFKRLAKRKVVYNGRFNDLGQKVHCVHSGQTLSVKGNGICYAEPIKSTVSNSVYTIRRKYETYLLKPFLNSSRDAGLLTTDPHASRKSEAPLSLAEKGPRIVESHC
jgi:hypothetical protein